MATAATAVVAAPFGNIADKSNAALYFPRLRMPDPLAENALDRLRAMRRGGRRDRADRRGARRLEGAGRASTRRWAACRARTGQPRPIDAENGLLNPLGINCLRDVPERRPVVWGARTLRRRRPASPTSGSTCRSGALALFIEESLYRGTQWVVFEPNDEPLWAQIRLNVGAFMQNLFRQGAFQGTTPREAYFVKCDKETTTQNDINLGIVNIVVGFAPLKPAEFVVIKIQQIAGQIQA